MTKKANKVNRQTTHRLIYGFLILVTFLVQQPILLNSICPDGYLFPDCSETCPHGFYGLNCSSSCSGTCLNFSCLATTGNCFRCLPGLRGPTCSDYCATGRFGKDCAQKCPQNCVMETCNPFTGFCLRCLDGFTGKRCHFPSREADLETRERKAEAEESKGKENQVLVISLTVVALLIIPACAVVVVLPRLRKKIRKRKMRLKREAYLRKQLSEAICESKVSSTEFSNDPFGGHPIASVSEISDPLPIMLRLRRSFSEMFAGRKSLLERRKHAPIYIPTRSGGNKEESSQMQTSSSVDFASFGKSMKRSDFTQQKRIKRLVTRKDSPIVLSTTPFHVPRRSKSKLHASNSIIGEDIDANARRKLDLDLRGTSVVDHGQLFFKTMPSTRPETDDKTGMKKIKVEDTAPSLDSNSLKIKESSTKMINHDGRDKTRGNAGEEPFGRLSATSIQQSSDSDDSKILEKMHSNVKASDGLQKRLPDAEKSLHSRQLRSEWPMLDYPKSCTLAVVMDQTALSPYQTTTHPISTKRIHSPYSILTHVNSVAGFGRIMNAFLGYFHRSRCKQRPRASLTIKDLGECRSGNSKQSDQHTMPCNALNDSQNLNLKDQCNKGEHKYRPLSVGLEVGTCVTKDKDNRYQDCIHKTSRHLNTPKANHRTFSGSTQSNTVSNKTNTEDSHEDEEIKFSLSAQRVNRNVGFWNPTESLAETMGIWNGGGLNCVTPLKEDKISDKHEVYELCSDNHKADMYYSPTRTNRMFMTIESPEPSNDMFMTLHSHFGNDEHMPFQSGTKDVILTSVTDYNPLHLNNVEIGRSEDGNPEGEARHVIISDHAKEEQILVRSFPFQKTDVMRLSELDESAFEITEEGQQPIINQSVRENASERRHLESQQLYQISKDIRLPNESLENISDSSDVLSTNCNQPIITRTGRHSYQVHREEGLSLDDRFPDIYFRDELPPWELPCNQLLPPEPFVPEATFHQAIPPINTGSEILEQTPTFRFTSVDRKTKLENNEGDFEPSAPSPKLVSPRSQEQPLIHFSMKPASVKATDFYLGKTPQNTKRDSLTTIDTIQAIKYEKCKSRNVTAVHKPSKSTLTKSTQVLRDSLAKRVDVVKGGTFNYDHNHFLPSNKNTQHGEESPSSLKSSDFHEKQVKDFFEIPDPSPETKDILSLPEENAFPEKRAIKSQTLSSAESRQPDDLKSAQRTTSAISIDGKHIFNEVPEHENETRCSSTPESKIVQGSSELEMIVNEDYISQEGSLLPSKPSDDTAMATLRPLRSQRSILHGDDGSSREDTRKTSWHASTSMMSGKSRGLVVRKVNHSTDDSKDTVKSTQIRSEPGQLKSGQSDESVCTGDPSKNSINFDNSRKVSEAVENTGSELSTNEYFRSQVKLDRAQNEFPETVSIQESKENLNGETKSLEKRSFSYPMPSLLETWFTPTDVFRKDKCSLLNMETSLKSGLLTGMQTITYCKCDMSLESPDRRDRYADVTHKRKQSCARSFLKGGTSVDEKSSHRSEAEEKSDEQENDDSDSEEYQDALSMQSFRRDSNEAMAGCEILHLAVKTSRSKATASTSRCASSSTESLCKISDCIVCEGKNNDKKPSNGNLCVLPIESSSTNAKDSCNPDNESKGRAQEDRSSFSQTSYEQNTYTVQPTGILQPTVKCDLVREEEAVELGNSQCASLNEHRNFRQRSSSSSNFKQKETDVKLETRQKEAAEPSLQTRVKSQRQGHKDHLELDFNLMSNIKFTENFKTSSDVRKVQENKNQKRKPDREHFLTKNVSLGIRKKKERLSDSSLDQRLKKTKGIDALSGEGSVAREKGVKGPKEVQDKKITVSTSRAPDIKEGRESFLAYKHKNSRDESSSRKRVQSESWDQLKEAGHSGNRILYSGKAWQPTGKYARQTSPPRRRDMKSCRRKIQVSPTPVQRALSETRQARPQMCESRPQSKISSNESSKNVISKRKSHDKRIAFFKNTTCSESEFLSSSPPLSFTEFFYDVTDQ